MKPNNIFKFVSVRPPQQPSPENLEKYYYRYSKDAHSPFHSRVQELEGDNRRAQAIDLALDFLHSDDYLPDNSDLVAAVRTASDAETAREAKSILNDTLDMTIEDILADDDLRDQLWDSLYAQTLAPNERPHERNDIYAGLRALRYIQLLNEADDDEPAMTWNDLQSISLLVPKTVIPEAPSPQQAPRDQQLAEWATEQLSTLLEELRAIDDAIADIRNNHRIYKATELRKIPVAIEEIEEGSHVAGIRQIIFETVEVPFVRAAPRLFGPAVSGIELPEVNGEEVARDMPEGEQVEDSLGTLSVVLPPKPSWIFEDFGNEKLKDTTKALLETHRIKFQDTEVVEVASLLEGKRMEIAKSVLGSIPRMAVPYVLNSESYAHIAGMVALAFAPPAGASVLPVPPPEVEPEPGSAAARGIRSLGVGDLLVVKQELLRYVAGEVAHIENILHSEHKGRTHTRMRETEEIIITETEEMEESEKDLQSTQRFELQTETQKTIESDMKLEAGISVSGSYGTVSVTAHADFALSQSQSQSQRAASSFAKEVVERSTSRIMQRAREERTRRTLERFEEVNEHGFDNTDGDGHVIGIYRWVDKYYNARIVNYGRRLMIEFIIPEPAAFFLHTQERELTGVTMEKPKEPSVGGRRLEPDDLDRWNYMDYVGEYNVQDVESYPAEYIRVSAAIAEVVNPNNNTAFAATSEKLVVPTGYVPWNLYGAIRGVQKGDGFIEVLIGAQESFSGGDRITGVIPISVSGSLEAFQVNVGAQCELTDEARAKWQLKTFSAIMNAYERQLADYYEQVAAAELQAGIQIEGRNPEINRKLEQEELRKAALRLLTNDFAKTKVSGVWHWGESFNAAYDGGAYGYPEFHIDEAIDEGKFIQFFEQAFDWHNMTYRFYPYFWGRKSKWKENLQLDDPDPKFTDFIRAGAARVVVPVQLNYEEAVLHYLYTNEIWNGGEPPTIEDPLYISIVDEIRSATDADLDGDLPICSDDETDYPCIVDEWELKLPTSLVYLQPDSKLPDFTRPDTDQGEIVNLPEGIPEPRMVIGERGRVNPNNTLALHVREAPGLDAAIVTAWPGGVEFDVLDGPRLQDNYLWWQVDNGTDSGWCAEGEDDYYFMEPIP